MNFVEAVQKAKEGKKVFAKYRGTFKVYLFLDNDHVMVEGVDHVPYRLTSELVFGKWEEDIYFDFLTAMEKLKKGHKVTRVNYNSFFVLDGKEIRNFTMSDESSIYPETGFENEDLSAQDWYIHKG